MTPEIILTHCGKLGDMLYSLPVGSILHHLYGRKIHWVLPRSFGPFRYIENLLMAQEMTSHVTLVDHQIRDFSCGGQPYRFDPATFGIAGEYYNLGFPHYPDKPISQLYVQDCLGMGDIRQEFYLNIGLRPALANRSGCLRSSELAMQMLMPGVQPLPTSMDLLELAQTIAAAKEFHTWFNGLAVLCWLAGLPAHVYRVQGHAPTWLYFPEPRDLIIHELAVHPKDMVRK